MNELIELYKQMSSEVNQARFFAQKGLDCKKSYPNKAAEYIGIAEKKLAEIDALHKIAISKLETIKKESMQEASNSIITEPLIKTDHKSTEGHLWNGAHEVSVRAYNEVKAMISVFQTLK